jgi:hypothetical protein
MLANAGVDGFVSFLFVGKGDIIGFRENRERIIGNEHARRCD